ncbi:small subunit ribosomal protein S3 [Mycoplasma testudineum]|uniref:Small ribosomal subunit protein uS3 n=1 Tax=Mycoplasma testudineum TaxID=244584 RepID=A0A4R6IGU6_9MOLU|nr:30S ribosomal protein S3 [Mycoplasma testudineum]OYD27150.1 30S ribosomal protein S3 [Mycoplasma testudineum]TDO21096.1 small subunit ribosomal protein S3 [Mycoplasma testudineum]
MGQKVNPNGFRYGITKERNSIWYADKKDFGNQLVEDQKIYNFFEKLTRQFQIAKVEIKRQLDKITVIVHSARRGAILGQDGKSLDELKTKLEKTVKNRKVKIAIDVRNVEDVNLSAKLVAEQIATDLENRRPFRTAQKFAIRNTLKAGAKGIKTAVSGRLNGVDMARKEGYSEGEMKLHTLRQNVDYATATARTTYGAIGVKVWISLGDISDEVKHVTTEKN